jgi:segregation and condensation protein B
MPGHPLIYSTSKNFMDYFGINSPEDLPKLKEIFDETMVNPTAISEQALENEEELSDRDTSSDAENEQEGTTDVEKSGLIVSENGELVIEAVEDENIDAPGDQINEEAAGTETDSNVSEQQADEVANDNTDESANEDESDEEENEEEGNDSEENDEEDQDSSNPDDKNRS